jgi:Flp pilus assembly pilin Flp
MHKRFWEDEGGAIISAELVLVLVIVVLGMIVGLVAVRDAVVTELADFAQALTSLDMSYEFAAIELTSAGAAGTAGTEYDDPGPTTVPPYAVVVFTDGSGTPGSAVTTTTGVPPANW